MMILARSRNAYCKGIIVNMAFTLAENYKRPVGVAVRCERARRGELHGMFESSRKLEAPTAHEGSVSHVCTEQNSSSMLLLAAVCASRDESDALSQVKQPRSLAAHARARHVHRPASRST